MDGRKVTIFDVVEATGLSKGTIDRVLHNRGEVSKESVEKVRCAIRELGYVPNAAASVLGSKNPRVVATLFPDSVEGEYWHLWKSGIEVAVDRLSVLNLSLRAFTYNQYDGSSFASAASSLLEESPDAVIMPALFKADTLKLAGQLREKGIPYVYVDTEPGDDRCLAYFGMPMYESGRLCAALLTERLTEEQVKRVLAVRILRDAKGESDPTVERRRGFNDFMLANFPGCVVDSVFISPVDAGESKKALDVYFSEHPDVRLVTMFNSRVHLIGQYLRERPDAGRRVVAFDDLPRNVELLRDGTVSVLVGQRVAELASVAVDAVSDSIIKGLGPEIKVNHSHMDILTRYNL